jgi:DnaJ-class molecular chaperone
MKNPYETLGVNPTADANEIKRAYRRLASQHHPDKGGDKVKFQEIQSAYDTLTNPQKRAAYDNPSPFGPGGPAGFNFNFGPGNAFDFENIFNVFGARFQQPHQQRSQHARMSLWITLEDIAQGGRKTVSVASSHGNMTVEIEIPFGIDDGDTVQYAKTGPMGMDLLITFRIHPNARWQRQGVNLMTEKNIDVWDLILGAEIPVQDILGNALTLTIPPRTQPGTVFRLREKGLRQRNGVSGDMLVKAQAKIPDHIPLELIDAISKSRNH